MDNYKIYLWEVLEADLDKTQENYHKSITLIKSKILIPVGLVISGIFVYRRQQANAYIYQVI